jgi:hypothetical protein
MEDKRKLTAAIMGAIIACIHLEKQSSSLITSEVKPQPEVSQQKPNPTNIASR